MKINFENYIKGGPLLWQKKLKMLRKTRSR